MYISMELLEKAEHRETESLREFRVDVPEGQSGEWSVGRTEVPFDIPMMRMARDGRSPGLGAFTTLRRNGVTIMSDTNAEVHDLRRHLPYLTGHVLVTGLGLGMTVNALLNIPRYAERVDSVTVVEQSPDVVNLCWNKYAGRNAKLVIADAYEYVPARRFDSAWHDIWDDISPENRPLWRRMKAHYAAHMAKPGNQFCWGQDVLRRTGR